MQNNNDLNNYYHNIDNSNINYTESENNNRIYTESQGNNSKNFIKILLLVIAVMVGALGIFAFCAIKLFILPSESVVKSTYVSPDGNYQVDVIRDSYYFSENERCYLVIENQKKVDRFSVVGDKPPKKCKIIEESKKTEPYYYYLDYEVDWTSETSFAAILKEGYSSYKEGIKVYLIDNTYTSNSGKIEIIDKQIISMESDGTLKCKITVKSTMPGTTQFSFSAYNTQTATIYDDLKDVTAVDKSGKEKIFEIYDKEEKTYDVVFPRSKKYIAYKSNGNEIIEEPPDLFILVFKGCK